MDNSSVNSAISRSRSPTEVAQVPIPPSDIYNINNINLQYMNTPFPNTNQHISGMENHVNINSNATNGILMPNIATAVPSISQAISNIYDFDIPPVSHLPIREPEDVIQIGIELQRHRAIEFEHARTHPYEPLALTRTYHVHRNNITGRITLIRDSNTDITRRSEYVVPPRDCYLENTQIPNGISLQRSEEVSDNQINYVPYRQQPFPYNYENHIPQQSIFHQSNGYHQPQHSISTSFHSNSIPRPSPLPPQRQKRPHGNASNGSSQPGASRLPKIRRVNSSVEDNPSCTSQTTSEHQERLGFNNISQSRRDLFENIEQRRTVPPRIHNHQIHTPQEHVHSRSRLPNTWPMSLLEINRQIMNSLYTIEANIPHTYPNFVYPVQQNQMETGNTIPSNSQGTGIQNFQTNHHFSVHPGRSSGRQFIHQTERGQIYNRPPRTFVENLELQQHALEQIHQNNRVMGMAVPLISGFSPADFHYIQAFTHYNTPAAAAEAAPVGLSTEDIKKFTTIMPFSKDSQSDENESERCTVCLCDFDSGDEVRALNCSHKFHVECIDQWLNINKKCPLCREDVDKVRGLEKEPNSSSTGRIPINSTVHTNVHNQATVVDV
uniref:RING-type domain-containing protein n=1 Tax=Parastrongyloides trichosuri TaxID=131310 RepID=A0A0N4Z2B8_PARTI